MTRVVLTGASRGIGRATALALAKRRADLALLGRDSDELRETTARVRELGTDAQQVDCDLASPEEIAAAAARVLKDGPVDALVHDAAVIFRKRVEDTELADWDAQLSVNLRAPFLLTRALLPHLRTRPQARIVFVGSISSTLGTARSAAYNASKWGVVGFMKSLAEEVSDSPVSTVAVLPGSVGTRMLEGSGFTPRMSAEEVASTIVHYTLDASAAHNGGVVEMFGT